MSLDIDESAHYTLSVEGLQTQTSLFVQHKPEYPQGLNTGAAL